jgi:hypothetical protein
MTPGLGRISKTLIFGGADSGENLSRAIAAVRPGKLYEYWMIFGMVWLLTCYTSTEDKNLKRSFVRESHTERWAEGGNDAGVWKHALYAYLVGASLLRYQKYTMRIDCSYLQIPDGNPAYFDSTS